MRSTLVEDRPKHHDEHDEHGEDLPHPSNAFGGHTVGGEHHMFENEDAEDERPVTPYEAKGQHDDGDEEFDARIGAMQPSVA